MTGKFRSKKNILFMKFLSAEILELTAHPTLDPGGTVSADWLLGRMGGVRLSHRKLWDLRQSWTILSLSLSLLSPPLPGWGGGLTISPDYTDCDEVLSRMACWPHISHICCPILVLSPTVESWAGGQTCSVLTWYLPLCRCHPGRQHSQILLTRALQSADMAGRDCDHY